MQTLPRQLPPWDFDLAVGSRLRGHALRAQNGAPPCQFLLKTKSAHPVICFAVHFFFYLCYRHCSRQQDSCTTAMTARVCERKSYATKVQALYTHGLGRNAVGEESAADSCGEEHVRRSKPVHRCLDTTALQTGWFSSYGLTACCWKASACIPS